MINILLIIVLIISYILNSLYIISYYQNDNYHYRSFIRILLDDLKTRPQIILLIPFIFISKTQYLNIVVILLLLIFCLPIVLKNKPKIKKTKRLLRLLGIDLLPIILIFIVKARINGLLVINIFYLLINFLLAKVATVIEKMLNIKYYKQAKNRLNKYQPMIIGITGSCGKTSVKNYIYECISQYDIAYKSPKSYNTLIGLAITINKYLNCYYSTLILEMGLSHKKDITKITNIIKPNISIITEILPSHLETMKTMDNIIEEKMQIIKKMKPEGLIIANYDNDYIKNNINKYNINNNKIIKIGFNEDNDYYCKEYKLKKDGLELNIISNITKKEYLISTYLIGKHNIYNILIVLALLKYLNYDDFKTIGLINKLSNYENRLEIKKYKQLTILNDSYNSNINGFLSALEILSLYDTKKYIITPGIVEIGDKTNETISLIADKICEICDYCYLIDNKNTSIFIEKFKKNNYTNFIVKKSFKQAFNEVKNMDLTLLIENDLTEFYLLK